MHGVRLRKVLLVVVVGVVAWNLIISEITLRKWVSGANNLLVARFAGRGEKGARHQFEEAQQRGVRKLEFGPFSEEGLMDVVITYVNTSDPRWVSFANSPGGAIADDELGHGFPQKVAYNPSGESLSTNFVDLKYCLRGLVKNGLMKYVRNIYVVHSDLNDPPNYLKKDHPKLKMVPHSVTFRKWPDTTLPMSSRNSNDWNLHNIPGLSEWFLRLDDDLFLVNLFEVADFWRDGKALVHGGVIGPAWWPCTSSNDGYWGAKAISSCLLQQTFGYANRRFIDHWPVLVHRPSVEAIETEWCDWVEQTIVGNPLRDQPGDLNWGSMVQMYMVDTGKAVYSERSPEEHPSSTGASTFALGELHTNADAWCPQCDGYEVDASDAVVSKLNLWLKMNVSKYRWLGLQGPGFDDAYRYLHNPKFREYSPKIHAVAREFFEQQLPTKTEFEV